MLRQLIKDRIYQLELQQQRLFRPSRQRPAVPVVKLGQRNKLKELALRIDELQRILNYGPAAELAALHDICDRATVGIK